jgi:O-methyltransferase domain
MRPSRREIRALLIEITSIERTAPNSRCFALERLLRLLAGYGAFAVHNGAFVHTPASALLRSDHSHSLRSFVRMMGFPIYWRMWEAFDVTVRTGAAAATEVLPEGSWKYLADHQEEARIFDEAMTAKSQAQMPAILQSYDFSRFARIADIGGGHGHLLRAVLAATPSITGVLYDLPHVVEAAAQSAAEALHAGRERTRGEYAGLLGTAGFRLLREIDTQAGVSLLEARTVTAASAREG